MCACKEYAGGEVDERLVETCPECQAKSDQEDADFTESLYRCKCGDWKRIDASACEGCLTDYAEIYADEVCA